MPGLDALSRSGSEREALQPDHGTQPRLRVAMVLLD